MTEYKADGNETKDLKEALEKIAESVVEAFTNQFDMVHDMVSVFGILGGLKRKEKEYRGEKNGRI